MRRIGDNRYEVTAAVLASTERRTILDAGYLMFTMGSVEGDGCTSVDSGALVQGQCTLEVDPFLGGGRPDWLDGDYGLVTDWTVLSIVREDRQEHRQDVSGTLPHSEEVLYFLTVAAT